jgi:hypothetical protein
MPRWLRRLFNKWFVRVVYSPEVEQLGPVGDSEWEGLLAELSDGYEKHRPVFLALQILLRRVERDALRVPVLKTPADLELWNSTQRALIREANALRFALRLPIEGQRLKKRKEKAEEMKKRAKAEADVEAHLD